MNHTKTEKTMATPEVKPATLTKIPVTTSVDNNGSNSVYARLETYTRDKGLSKVQDSIRLAIVFFLEKQGY